MRAAILIVAMLVIGNFGCGSSRIEYTPLTVLDYAKLCAGFRAQSVTQYETNFEAVSAIRDMTAGLRSIAPLPEVVKVHHARLKMLDELIDALMQQSPNRKPDLFFYDYRYPDLYSAREDYNESQYALSPVDRELLLSEGCITRRAF